MKTLSDKEDEFNLSLKVCTKIITLMAIMLTIIGNLFKICWNNDSDVKICVLMKNGDCICI